MKILCFNVFMFFSAAFLFACGQKDIIQVTGKVRLVGNAPFYNLVISAEGNTRHDGREWYIDNNEISEKERVMLINLQQQTVTVKGKEYFRDIIFANGDSAGRQYFLKDIKIIN